MRTLKDGERDMNPGDKEANGNTSYSEWKLGDPQGEAQESRRGGSFKLAQYLLEPTLL